MCGIVGCVAEEGCYQKLFTALRRLEYRGYDSAGVAFLGEGGLRVRKRRGGVKNIEGEPIAGSAGIGHTRWATHGAPSDANAHPHLCGKFALVHNGIIENAAALRAELERAGERFVSQTDSEVIVHLIAGAYASGDTGGAYVREGGGTTVCAGGGTAVCAGGGQVCGGAHADTGESVKVCGGGQEAACAKAGGFFAAVAAACARLQGSYAIAVLCADCPEQMVCARRGSPLVAGAGEGALYVCSDVPALAGLASYVCPAADGEFIHICNGRIRFLRADGTETAKTFSYLPPQTPAPAPEGCRMLAEIAETPRALRDTLACLREVNFLPHARRFARAERVFAVACGTAYHAALGFAAALEGAAGIPVLHCRASEFFARAPLVRAGEPVVAVSQSGETADTLAAVRLAKERGAFVIAVTNAPLSTLAAAADLCVPLCAGPEVAVAATKSYTCQLLCLYYLAAQVCYFRGGCFPPWFGQLSSLPAACAQAFGLFPAVDVLASRLQEARGMYFLGREQDLFTAMEGALKVKEIAYVFAEGYPAGELKHGSLALVEEGFPVVMAATRRSLLQKCADTLAEVSARGGYTALFSQYEGCASDFFCRLPAVCEPLMPAVAAVPLQYLACRLCLLRGHDPDRPRNLAKSVTVE